MASTRSRTVWSKSLGGVLAPVILALVWPATAAVAGTSASCSTHGTYAKAVRHDNPVVYYRLDDRNGPAACDASGGGNAGAYAGSGITYRASGALLSKPDGAITSDGTVNPVTGPVLALASGNPSFSLEGWYRSTSTNDQMVVDFGQSGTHQVAGVGVWNTNLLFVDLYADSVSWDVTSAGVNLRDGNWHLLDATYDSARLKFTGYVDGVKVGTATISSPMSFAGGPVRVGYWVDTVFNEPFNGSMDEAAVYAATLSAKRVAAHYTASGRTAGG